MKRTLTILLAATLLFASLGMTASPVMAADATDDPITALASSSDGPITAELLESMDGPITDSTDGPITATSPITSTDAGTQDNDDCDDKTKPA